MQYRAVWQFLTRYQSKAVALAMFALAQQRVRTFSTLSNKRIGETPIGQCNRRKSSLLFFSFSFFFATNRVVRNGYKDKRNATHRPLPTSTVAGPKRDRIQEKGKMTRKTDAVTKGDS